MSMGSSFKNAEEGIRSTYRIVLGATVSFLPFVLFFLVKESTIDLLPAVIFWLLTWWVIISELWSIEDITNYYTNPSKLSVFISMIYLIVLTMLPLAIILGLDKPLDKPNVLEEYMIILVGEGRYRSIQPYVFMFAVVSLVDIMLQFSYWRNQEEDEDKKFFLINMVMDGFLLIIYLLIWYLATPILSVIWGAIWITVAYSIEWSVFWIVIPKLFPKTYEE